MDRPPREIHPENDDPGRDRAAKTGPGTHQPISRADTERLNKDRQQAQASGLPSISFVEKKPGEPKEYHAKAPVPKPKLGSMTKEQRQELKEKMGRGEVAREPKRRER